MKLIDADKLYEKRFTVLDNIETVPVYRSVIKAYDVRNEPTIEAIPVEWIKKYIEDHTYEMVNPKYVDDTYNYVKFTEEPLDYCLTVMPIQVKAMLADWERENG